MSVQLAVLLFKLINTLVGMFEEQRWYQQGRDAAYAEINAEQKKRIDEADAARRDADALNVGDGVLKDDGHARD